MIGIYTITNPAGKIYVGQSVDIQKRWRGHRCSKYRSKLKSSFLKYGFDNHVFRVIKEFPEGTEIEVLNEQEILFIDLYKRSGFELLNIREGGRNGRLSDESKKLISEAGKGRKHSEEMKHKMSLRLKGHTYNNGRKLTDDHKLKISLSQKGKTHTKEHRDNNSKSKKGERCYLHGINPSCHPQARRVIDTVTGRVYGTITEAAKAHNINRTTLNVYLAGRYPNKTTLQYDLK